MKIVKILSLTLFVSLLVFSCKKDDDGDGDANAASGTITAKVNGANFSSNTSFTVANKVTAGGITTVTIQGSNNQGKGVVLIINGFEGTGSYNIGGGANVFVTGSYVEANASNPQASQTWMAPFDASLAGEINISEANDTKIKGSFNFNAKNSMDNSIRNITEGSFNVDF